MLSQTKMAAGGCDLEVRFHKTRGGAVYKVSDTNMSDLTKCHVQRFLARTRVLQTKDGINLRSIEK
jgi:hypothetical protein